MQNPRAKLRELQPTLRRYNFVLENLAEESEEKSANNTALFKAKYKVADFLVAAGYRCKSLADTLCTRMGVCVY